MLDNCAMTCHKEGPPVLGTNNFGRIRFNLPYTWKSVGSNFNDVDVDVAQETETRDGEKEVHCVRLSMWRLNVESLCD